MGIFGKHLFQNDGLSDSIYRFKEVGAKIFFKELTVKDKFTYEEDMIVAGAFLDALVNKTKYDFYSNDFRDIVRLNKTFPAIRHIEQVIPLMKYVISSKSHLNEYMKRSSIYFHWLMQVIEIIQRLSLVNLNIQKPGIEIKINSYDLLNKLKSPAINGDWVLGVNRRSKTTEILLLTDKNKVPLMAKFDLFPISKLIGNSVLSKVDQINSERRYDKNDKCYRISFTNTDIDFEWNIYTASLKREIDGPKLNVFLCHSSTDKEKIETLHTDLVNGGINAWYSDKNLIGGQDWKFEIQQALKNTNIVIVCLSKTSVTKVGFVQKEIKYALDIADEYPEGSIFIIPLRLEDCPVPERLKQFHRIDYFNPEGFSQLYRGLKTIESSMYMEKRGLLNYQ